MITTLAQLNEANRRRGPALDTTSPVVDSNYEVIENRYWEGPNGRTGYTVRNNRTNTVGANGIKFGASKADVEAWIKREEERVANYWK